MTTDEPMHPNPNTPIFDSMVDEGLLDPKKVEFTDMRYNTGRLGKNKKQVRDRLSGNFSEAFNVLDLNEVPNKAKLDDLWAYMNFHLNFKKLLEENRQKKLIQKLKYVENITDLISPENCLALYFLGYLENKIFGKIKKSTNEKLYDYISDIKTELNNVGFKKRKNYSFWRTADTTQYSYSGFD